MAKGSSLNRKETLKEGTLEHQEGRKNIVSKNMGYYIMVIWGTLHSDKRANPPRRHSNPKCVYIKQKSCKLCEAKLIELKEETNKLTITVGDFKFLHQQIGRTTRQKIIKDREELNNTINQQDIIDIYRLLHQMTAEHTFFSNARGTWTKINHIQGHKPQEI